MYAASNLLSFMSTCMTLWMRVLFVYQNMCFLLKIHFLHLKSDFITLKSSEHLLLWFLLDMSFCLLLSSLYVPLCYLQVW